MARSTRLVLSVAVFLAIPVTSPAQTRPDRLRFGVSGGIQMTRPLEQSLSTDTYVEPAPITAKAKRSALPLLDVGVVVPLRRDVGVTAAFSYAGASRDVPIEADIPHPFYFDRLRSVSGRVGDVRHSEAAVHVGGAYLIVGRRLDVVLGGGVTLFSVDQDLVTGVVVDEAYPYDSATFANASLSRVRVSAVGYHAAADVTWKVSPRWGIGVLARFARARPAFDVGSLDAGEATAGGAQVAAGLRLVVPQRSKPRRRS